MNPPLPSSIDAADGTGRSGLRRSTAVLVTGAGGEMGHAVLRELAERRINAVAIDIRELDPDTRALCRDAFIGDICDPGLLDRLLASYEIDEIHHLAALLSTRGEFAPETAHRVNVGGTLNLLHLAAEQARTHGRTVRFLFPSSIAVYGVPDLATKRRAGRVREDQFLEPRTMYGVNKLEGEHLGRYYERHYRLLAKDRTPMPVDFRSIRFPGILSAETVPSGGTSDYGPEMIHAAASGRAYACFVRPDTRIPFTTMPEAIRALLELAAAPKQSLSRIVYNIGGFSPSAEEFRLLAERAFPGAEVSFAPDAGRQSIVDSWPEDVDDSAARKDWGWAPTHTLESAFEEYLAPSVRSRYA
ncbi:MAG: NAD-dependent epimerase/dehydratase family protein [Phycisphaerae bacterium]|nr:NAD-dependent epimerase/dehydratase family protein [Phycisphaerae bacterium]